MLVGGASHRQARVAGSCEGKFIAVDMQFCRLASELGKKKPEERMAAEFGGKLCCVVGRFGWPSNL